jgi:hypothetical protein
VAAAGDDGLRLLLEAARRLDAAGRALALIPGPASEKILALTSAEARFTIRRP